MNDVADIKQRNIELKKLIDALYSIRLDLCIKKVNKPTISKEELKITFDNAKANSKDDAVALALDNLFDEYFEKNEKQKLNNNVQSDIKEQPDITTEVKSNEYPKTLVKKSSKSKKDN